MSDDKTLEKPEEDKQFDLDDPKEIMLWCKLFNCTEGDLRVAVMAVGKSQEAIKEYFNN